MIAATLLDEIGEGPREFVPEEHRSAPAFARDDREVVQQRIEHPRPVLRLQTNAEPLHLDRTGQGLEQSATLRECPSLLR